MRYSPDIRNQVRRTYLLKGPCQPHSHKFPQRVDGNRNRRFICLYCYLFSSGRSGSGHDAFVTEKKSKIEYHCRLNASIVCLHYLLMQGLTLRGNDECEESLNQRNFIELYLGDDLFFILVDECRDVSVKEQMGVFFLAIMHVNDTSASSLKKAIEFLFSTHGLSVSSLRDQGYDGASKVREKFNGLKNLILRENSSSYYIHCFAHQLQLTLIAIAKKYSSISIFFNIIARLCNVVGGCYKRRDMLQEKQREKVVEGIKIGEIAIGQGFKLRDNNKETKKYLLKNDNPPKVEAIELLDIISRFEFVFTLFLMRKILGITHNLSQAFQRRDQDIANAMQLVKESLLFEIMQFCSKHNIVVLEMDDLYTIRGRSRRRTEKMTKLHFYRVEQFYSVIDMQLQELNNHFDKVNTNLLLYMACLDPKDSFSAFNVSKLIELAKLHPFATATVERAFSAMHIIKNRLCNKMRDDLFNDYLITYIERDVFINVDNKDIINKFQAIKNRREIL
ncbi:hypothetical protein MANES_18G140700v8 [Manihot esculenta]|uniref:Uncharacterized protein n=1 Tax=Manihot esculenta TaxID=3983 RepID=A0ACB7G0H5_MANES|nr:hypothetical protein MANES_18G140700v8 [Manihot esculenta]